MAHFRFTNGKIISSFVVVCCLFSISYGCSALRTCGYAADVSISKNFNMSKKRVAVLPFVNSGKEGFNSFASDHLAQGLMEMGFTIIERQRLQVLFDELQLDMLGNLSISELTKIRQLSGIDIIVFGSISYIQYATRASTYDYADGISVRFVDMATGEVFLSGRTVVSIGNEISWGTEQLCCGIKGKILPQDK